MSTASLSRYRLGRELGRGVSGVVYAAFDVHSGATVAVKKSSIARAPPGDVAALEREVETLSRLASPHVLPYLASFRDAEHVYLVTELIEGGSLAALVARHGPLPERLASFFIAQALCGLDYVHGEGLLHRDVKAANMLVDKGGVLLLSDFGLVLDVAKADQYKERASFPPTSTARSGGSESSRGGASARAGVTGSAHWWAPEIVALEAPSAAADIWALGATVIELVTGAPPFGELSALAACFRIADAGAGPPLPPSASPALQGFLRACFTRDQRARPAACALLCSEWIMSSLDELARDPTRTTSRLLLEVHALRSSVQGGSLSAEGGAAERRGTLGSAHGALSETPSGADSFEVAARTTRVFLPPLTLPSLPTSSAPTALLCATADLQAVAEAAAASTLRLVCSSSGGAPSPAFARGMHRPPLDGFLVVESAAAWSPGDSSLASIVAAQALSSPALRLSSSFGQPAPVAAQREGAAERAAFISSLVDELAPARVADRGIAVVRHTSLALLGLIVDAEHAAENLFTVRTKVVTIVRLLLAHPNDDIITTDLLRLFNAICKDANSNGAINALSTACMMGVLPAVYRFAARSTDVQCRGEASAFMTIVARSGATLPYFLTSGGVKAALAAINDAYASVSRNGIECALAAIVLSDATGLALNIRAEFAASNVAPLLAALFGRHLRNLVAFASTVASLEAPESAAMSASPPRDLHRAASLTWTLSSTSSSSHTATHTEGDTELDASDAIITSPLSDAASTDFRFLQRTDITALADIPRPRAVLHLSPAAELIISDINAIATLTVTLACGDVEVRTALAVPTLVKALLRLLRPSPLSLLTQPSYALVTFGTIRTLKKLSQSMVSADVLASAGTIEVLTALLARIARPGCACVADLAPNMLITLFFMLRFNRARASVAAAAGLAMPLISLASVEHAPASLRTLAVQLLCDICRASGKPAARELLFAACTPATLTDFLLHDTISCKAHCLGALAALAAADSTRVGDALLLADRGARGRPIDAIASAFFTLTSSHDDPVAELAAPLAALVERVPPAVCAALALSSRCLTAIWDGADSASARLAADGSCARSALLLRHLLAILMAVFEALPAGARASAAADAAAALSRIASRVTGRVVLAGKVAALVELLRH